VDTPLISKAVAICAWDFLFNTLAALLVFSSIGILQLKTEGRDFNLLDLDLIFIALPTAINDNQSPNLWVFCLGALLFLLGIDSSTSNIEFVSAGI
jgi:SNF family Na+-dependent transporter